MNEEQAAKRDVSPRGVISAFWYLWRRDPGAFYPTPRDVAEPERWPPGYDPERCAVYARNELFLRCPPEAAFEMLIAAASWPRWYPNSRDVRVSSDDRRLGPGVSFTWRTFGVRVRSKVLAFDQAVISWDAHAIGLHACHRWLLRPDGDGTRMITEECQNGAVAWVIRPLMNRALHSAHDLWLQRLAERIRAAEPEPPAVP
jgi:hypothetical protein